MTPDAETVAEAVERLARMYRIIDTDDLRFEVPEAPWPVMVDGLRLAHNRRIVFHRHHPFAGYVSAIYDGAID